MRATHSSAFRRVLLAAAFVLVAASAGSAQVLRGSVRDSVSTLPIPGSVLILLDSEGRTLGRNITNEKGDYAIALPPQIARMQILRIGFRPRTVRVPAGTLRLDVTMTSIP